MINPKRILYGPDFFISYSRADSEAYAAALAKGLIDEGYTCFTDQIGTEPGKKIPASLKAKIKSSTVMVLLATQGAANSTAVADEIDTFLPTKRPLIPVDFGHINNAVWQSKITGVSVFEASANSLKSAHPQAELLERLINSFTYTRQRRRIRNTVLVVSLGVVAALIAIGLLFNIKTSLDKQILVNEATLKTSQKSLDSINKLSRNRGLALDSLNKFLIEAEREAENFKKLAKTNENLAKTNAEVADFREAESIELFSVLTQNLGSFYNQPSYEDILEGRSGCIDVPPIITIYIENDRYMYPPQMEVPIQQVYTLLRMNPEFNIVVEGHTSEYIWSAESLHGDIESYSLESRSKSYTETLSQKMAAGIANNFIERGIESNRIIFKGLGKQQPKYPIDFMNNRVEIKFVRSE